MGSNIRMDSQVPVDDQKRQESKHPSMISGRQLTFGKDDDASSGGSLASRLEEMPRENMLPLVLNLISAFLFIMNTYIVEPSSAYYANALGSSDALAGIMVGAAPAFSLVSAVSYSYATNYSYKLPILFASFLMVTGNLLYANAYGFHSMTMCLIGRAIVGLGTSKIMNRRYVADATPFSLRTPASAAFAMATALGAAMGPAMAIVLDLFEFEFWLPLLGTQYFNGMTGPGYFMCACWFFYSIAVVAFFREPSRSGIDELKKREQSVRDSIASNSSTLKVATPSIRIQDEVINTDGSLSDCYELYGDENDGILKDDMVSSPPTWYRKILCCSCIRHVTAPVILCCCVIFIKRIALETVVSSTSVITKNRYGWSIKNVGTLHFVNGLCVIPVSAFAGWLSTFYLDRYLSVWFLAMVLLGMGFLLDITDFFSHDNEGYNEDHWLSVGPVKYVVGSLIAFSGIEACESFLASLMTKVVPSSIAVGTWNSGLLITITGTAGRATGDAFITLMGLVSIRNLLNLLVLPSMILVCFSIFLIRHNYTLLGV